MEIIFKLFITSGPLRLCGSGGAATVGKGIAVTTVINLLASGGRKEFPVGGWVYSREYTSLPAGHRIPVGGWVYYRERAHKAPDPTHPPAGNPPLSGVLPLCTVGRDQYP